MMVWIILQYNKMKIKQSREKNKGVQDFLSYDIQISLSNPKLSLNKCNEVCIL